MNYCTTCFYPDTKPDLEFNQDGYVVLVLLLNKEKKINWKKEKEFIKVVKILKREAMEIMIVLYL